MPEDKGKVGQRIRAAYKAAGLTRREFARRMGVDESAVYRWERGERNPTMANVEKASEVTSADFNTLAGGVFTPRPAPTDPVLDPKTWEALARDAQRILDSLPESLPDSPGEDAHHLALRVLQHPMFAAATDFRQATKNQAEARDPEERILWAKRALESLVRLCTWVTLEAKARDKK